LRLNLKLKHSGNPGNSGNPEAAASEKIRLVRWLLKELSVGSGGVWRVELEDSTGGSIRACVGEASFRWNGGDPDSSEGIGSEVAPLGIDESPSAGCDLTIVYVLTPRPDWAGGVTFSLSVKKEYWPESLYQGILFEN